MNKRIKKNTHAFILIGLNILTSMTYMLISRANLNSYDANSPVYLISGILGVPLIIILFLLFGNLILKLIFKVKMNYIKVLYVSLILLSIGVWSYISEEKRTKEYKKTCVVDLKQYFFTELNPYEQEVASIVKDFEISLSEDPSSFSIRKSEAYLSEINEAINKTKDYKYRLNQAYKNIVEPSVYRTYIYCNKKYIDSWCDSFKQGFLAKKEQEIKKAIEVFSLKREELFLLKDYFSFLKKHGHQANFTENSEIYFREKYLTETYNDLMEKMIENSRRQAKIHLEAKEQLKSLGYYE